MLKGLKPVPKMRKAQFLLALVAVMALAGCGGGKTELVMVVPGDPSPAVFHLSCQPPRGDFPAPAVSCAALEKDPKIINSPSSSAACIGVLGRGRQVIIAGLIDGRMVQSSFLDLCGGPRPLVRARLYGAFVYQYFQQQETAEQPPGPPEDHP